MECVNTIVDGHKISLSNLSKPLYPQIGVTKADIIKYTMKVSDFMLSFIKYRPLTLIRFPDGITSHSFTPRINEFLETNYPRGRAIGVFRWFHFDLKVKNRNSLMFS